MGSVSDRSNPKYFLPLGLLLSCAIMFVIGHGEGDLRARSALVIVLQIAERLGPGHGLAAVRQDDGALVQHQGARAGRLVLERGAQRRRRRWSRPSRCSA